MKALIQGMVTVAALSVSSVHATPITIDIIGANWTNVAGGSNINYYNNDGVTGNEQVRWGNPHYYGYQSGYLFDGAAPPAFLVNTGDPFVLGNLWHFNYPISLGTGITSAQLNITANLTVNGHSISQGPFSFIFSHNETLNTCWWVWCTPGSSDIVSFTNLLTSNSFVVDNYEYTLELIGFIQNGEPTDEFITQEYKKNKAKLVGVFTSRPIDVSEGSPLALLGVGLLALGYTVRRRFV